MAEYSPVFRNLTLTPAEEAALSALLYSYVGGKGEVAKALGSIGEALGERYVMHPRVAADRPKFDVTNCHVAVNLEWPYKD